MITKKAAYEIALTVRADVSPTTTRDLPVYDAELLERLRSCWCFEVPITGEIIGTSYYVAVNKVTGEAFEYSYGE
jgi:hypothetical protein